MTRAERMKTCSLDELKELIGDKKRHELPLIEQEALYERLNRRSVETKLPVIVPKFRAQVFNKSDGKVTYDTGERPSYSATRNWWNFISGKWNFSMSGTVGATTWGDGTLSIKMQNGQTKTLSGNFTNDSRDGLKYGYRALWNAVSLGIVIGSDNQAEAFTDYTVVSIVNHGTNTGQLAYGVCQTSQTFVDGTTPIRKAGIYRMFSNLSSAPAIVREAVLYNRVAAPAGIANTGLCMMRDVLSVVATVAATQLMRLSYIFQMAYPSGV